MKCRVYYNLHKKCLSVQTKTEDGWRVTSHAACVAMKNVQFKVSEAGRQRVLKEQKKNVHAFIEGDLAFNSLNNTPKTLVRYNPYRPIGKFYVTDSDEVIDHASEVLINGKEILINK